MTDPRPDGSGDRDGPARDDAHRRPDGVDDDTVAAVGKLSEAVEWLERARGRLYDFHQMLGHLDLQMGDAVDMLREAGHAELAELVDREVVGRNVLDGRWTFQVIEEFEDVYYDPIRAVEQRVRDKLVGGSRHVFEAEMKEHRRTSGSPGHEPPPAAAHDPRVVTEPLKP
ncbi:MAG: hypothetical protein ABWZ76_10520 [Acidimicrobiales bacterium]